ncbi:DUF423 domain-containing protein [Pacificimonas flava]|uniref:DUF423 domain-containing protein n=1 Tax=Pacificimonas flava TaxID=1234595 RepID=M2TLV5_9SPHN|nr:DUF423 domain-containing protein [Pacificimonas flava]EMD82711.1 hypothetical protein C725_1751 [Pacificimonas flava]MBB5279330.1 uncharacterized membrane protein YgdD (TMEM256/DUF423 family) [Pacificimonas flava]
MSRYLAVLAGLHGLCGVAFAAIGAHAPAGPVVTTGATMQLIHAAAALGALALLPGGLGRLAVLLLLAGTLLFSGALYLSGLGGVSLGPVAPVGGVTMMAGWALIVAAAIRGPLRTPAP